MKNLKRNQMKQLKSKMKRKKFKKNDYQEQTFTFIISSTIMNLTTRFYQTYSSVEEPATFQ